MPFVNRLLHSTPLLLLSIQVSSFVVPWLIVLWLSHQQGAEQVGTFSYILALLAPLTLLLASPSRNFLLASTDEDDPLHISLRAYLGIVGLCIALAIGLWLEQWALVVAVYLFKVTEQLFDLSIAQSIKHRHTQRLLMITMSKWAAILVAAVIAIVTLSLPVTLIAISIIFVTICLYQQSTLSLSLNTKTLVELVKRALPLSLSALCFSVYFNIPRYIMGGEEDRVLLSVFTVASFLVMAGLVLVNTVVQSRLHMLKQAWVSDQKQEFMVHVRHCVMMIMGLFLALQIAHIPVLADLFWAAHNDIQLTDGDQTYVYTLVLLLSWGPLLFSFANYLFVISGRHKLLLLFTSSNIIFCYLLGSVIFDHFAFVGLMVLVSMSSVLQCIGGIWVLKSSRREI